jgi:integrase
MTCYFVGYGWRYEFQMKGQRYTDAKGLKTKKDAERAQALKKEEVRNKLAQKQVEQTEVEPAPSTETDGPLEQDVLAEQPSDQSIPSETMPEESAQPELPQESLVTVSYTKILETATDMLFQDLANQRLDYLQEYKSDEHFRSCKYMANRWNAAWGETLSSQVTTTMIKEHLKQRKKETSAYTANKELRCLRATLRYGICELKLDLHDPTLGIPFYPVDQKPKYVPPVADVDKVIAVADPDTQEYLLVIRETLGRVGEINRLRWDDVDFDQLKVTLYTRKNKRGNLVPRPVAMTETLYEVLDRMYRKRNPSQPWVFWHRYWSRKAGKHVCGPYGDRKKVMKRLCAKAGVRYFRYHALRHQGASVMDNVGTPRGEIQRILGHTHLNTTEGYLHGLDPGSRSAMEDYEAGRKRLGEKK